MVVLAGRLNVDKVAEGQAWDASHPQIIPIDILNKH